MKRIGCACTCSMDVLRCFTGTTYFPEVLTNQKLHNKCICHKFSWPKTVCVPAQREEAMSGLWIQNINKLSNLNNWKQSMNKVFNSYICERNNEFTRFIVEFILHPQFHLRYINKLGVNKFQLPNPVLFFKDIYI